MAMKPARLCRRYPFGVALLAFLVPAYLHLTFIFMAGFWDGFISELQRAEIPLFTWFDRFSVIMGFWFVLLGLLARRKDVRTVFLYSCIVYLLVALCVIETDQHYRAHLFDDRGG